MLLSLSVIRDYIQSWYEAVFRKGYLTAIACLLAVIISFNYSYSFPGSHNWWIRLLLGYLLYLVPFGLAWLLQWFYFNEDRSGFSKPWFWILLFAAPAFFAFRVSFNFHENILQSIIPAKNLRYAMAVTGYIIKVILLMLPVIFIWYVKDRNHHTLYGFSGSSNNKLYFILLLMMMPLVFTAASFPDFLQAYPKASINAGLHTAGSIWDLLLFELAYALDFLSIEFFFRGFLIIAFTRYFGMRAIVPAACFYCCIHLGKPMAEAISSFFGGLLLGIISYHTRSIWGGLFIHIGIAWLMEIAAYVSHHF